MRRQKPQKMAPKNIWLSAKMAMFDVLEQTKSLGITSHYNKKLMIPSIWVPHVCRTSK